MKFFLVDKPKGVTSYDVVEKFKRIFFGEKVGHGGTLDPMATGLLIIAVGRDNTKYLGKILGMNKEYITEIDFSIYTDTRDLDYFDSMINYKLLIINGEVKGIIKNQEEIKAPTLKEIKKKLDLLIPEYELPLTMFSAKKINGKKLYELAREGIDLNLNKKMKINSYEVLSYNFPKLKLKLNVGSGAYIRSVGYWLGQQFGLGGVLTMLRRTKVGLFELNG